MESILSRNGISWFITLTTLTLLAACGGSSGSSSGESSAGISTIDQLPLSVSPVVGSENASISKNLQLAESGVPLGELDSTTFTSTSSKAMCELSNRFREGIGSAAQADKILCYVQNVLADPDNAGLQEAGLDIYDGQFHVFALAFAEEQSGEESGEDQGGPGQVRMKIVRNEAGQITDFIMQSCDDLGGGELEQGEYVRQTIAEDGTFTMVSKGFFGEGGHEVNVSGSLNESGQFTSKTIQMAYIYADPNGNFSGEGSATLIQGVTELTYSGFENGTFSFEGQEGTFSNRVYALSELLDGNVVGEPFNLGLYAIGDGAARVNFSGAQGEHSWSDLITEGWNGDTTQVDLSVSQLSQLEGKTLPEITEITISFTEEEAYDCADEAEFTVQVNQNSLDQACANLDLGHDFIQCHNL